MSNLIRRQKINKQKQALAKKLRIEMTESENILWKELRTNKLIGLHFRRQQIIDGFIVDFYCHKARLIIEVDGAIHQTRIEYDNLREKSFISKDLFTIRFSNKEICNNLESVLKKIIEICIARMKTL